MRAVKIILTKNNRAQLIYINEKAPSYGAFSFILLLILTYWFCHHSVLALHLG